MRHVRRQRDLSRRTLVEVELRRFLETIGGTFIVLELLVPLNGVGGVSLEVAAVASKDLLQVRCVDVVLEARRGRALVVAEVTGERLQLVVHRSHVLVQASLGRRPVVT